MGGLHSEGRGRLDTEREAQLTLSEEVIVEKRVVPKEELVIKKHQVQDQEVVEADVRRERAEVRREGEVVSDRETTKRKR
jgi:uncharacterized protein (TIGR02271 family)